MPITTYLSESKIHKYKTFMATVLSNDERDILSRVPQTIMLAEYPAHPPGRRCLGILPPKKQEPLVEVLINISGIEWQVFNFPPRYDSDWSINGVVPLSEAKAWIWGLETGMRAAAEATKEERDDVGK